MKLACGEARSLKLWLQKKEKVAKQRIIESVIPPCSGSYLAPDCRLSAFDSGICPQKAQIAGH
jgi:hypothetical protein